MVAASPLTPRTTWLTVLLILTLTGGVYWSGLQGPFVFDDYYNIVDNAALRFDEGSPQALFQASVAGNAGPLKRPLSVLSFALNRATTGLDPFWFKLTNLLIHILNGALVFTLCRALLRADAGGEGDDAGETRIALFVTAAWLLHPVQLNSVLYVVQRMTSLSATFVFLGLIVYMRARQASASRARIGGLWLGVPLFAALATLAKESGALVVAYAFVVEATIFREAPVPGWRRGTPAQFFVVGLGLPLLAVAAFLLLQPEWLADAAYARGFSAGERMLSEARVLFLYLWLLVLPAISNLALFYDDVVVSQGLLEPPTTLLAVGVLCTAAVAAWRVRKRLSWFSFAVLWFLAGHAMESSFVMLELVHPHRNYVAYLGPMLALALLGRALLRRAGAWLTPVTVFTILAALAGTTALRAYQWRDPVALAAYEVAHRPGSARANYEFARLVHMAANGPEKAGMLVKADDYLARAAELAPTDVGALIGRVLIAEGPADEAVVRELTRRLTAQPLPPNQTGRLDMLVKCQRKAACRTPPEQMHAIFSAALSNPRLLPRVKSDLLTVLGTYYVEQMNDIPAALRVMQEAAALMPGDPSRNLNIAQLMLFVPDYDAAEAQLQLAERKDPIGSSKWRIERLRTDIAAFRERTGRAATDDGPNGPPDEALPTLE